MATNRYIKKVKQEDKKGLLVTLIILFSILSVIFSVGGFSYGRFATAIIMFFALSLNERDLLCLIMFAFPFANLLKWSFETISFVPILYVIILFKMLGKKRIRVSPLSLLCFLIFTAFQAVSIVIYEASYMKIIASLLNIAFVMFVSSHFNNDDAEKDLLPKASLFFSIATTLMLVLCDLFPRLPSMVHAKIYAEQLSNNRYTAIILDPNELSQMILVAIGLLIAIRPSIHTKQGKLACFAMMIYIAVTGVRTNSKSYVVTMVAIFLFLMFVYLRSLIKKEGANKALTKLVPILFVTVVGVILLIIYVIIPVFETRSSENADFLTNRGGIWSNYLYAVGQRLDVSLIGCGGGNVTHVMKLIGYETKGVPHNSYLEYFIQFGIVGIILLIITWKNVFTQIRDKITSYYMISLVAFLITAFAISINANDCPYILLSLLSLPLPENAKVFKRESTIKHRSKYIKQR